ncbi:hypothetical protein ABBQ32_005289 [Trebouxia sp. C0010 RCD-2024]
MLHSNRLPSLQGGSQRICGCGRQLLQRPPLRPARHRAFGVVRAAKRVKGNKGGGAAGKSPSKPSGNSGHPNYKSAGDVREGGAYTQETRDIILSLDRANKTAPNGKQILKNVGVAMYLGAKIGFLGQNGAGKSSLMRILAGQDQEYEGTLQLSPGIKVGYLQQEPVLDMNSTVLENIAPALAPTKAMLTEFEEVSMKMAEGGADYDALMKKMDKLQTAIDAIEGWELDRQLERAMQALRCPPGDSIVDNLSGGEVRRVALARLLLERPEVLLLDEPTNHLDADSVAWLERFLAEFKGTVVAVTHDRYFLDNVAGWILELDRGQGIPFEGNYSEWLKAKAKRLETEKRQQNSLQRSIASELEWVNTNAKGQQKKGKARLRRYDDLTKQASEYTRTSQLDCITIPQAPRLGSQVVEVENLSKSYGDRLLIKDLSFSVPPGSVVGIVGANGAGKSTLFRMLVGQEQPDSGNLKVGETVKTMYVDQSREALQSDRSVIDEIGEGAEEVDLGGRSVPMRAYASWFNFKGADQQKSVGVLSGGERNRLQLAKVLKQSGNLLLLDEPTNDLDVDTLRALESAIDSFAGSSMIISHDRWFLDRLATHILAFEGDSEVVWFEGSFSEYAADRQKRLGKVEPTRIKYRKLATV